MKLYLSENQGNSGVDEGGDWDVEDEVVTEEDLVEAERSGAKSLMEGAKDGNVPELHVKKKVLDAHTCFKKFFSFITL